MNYPILIVEDDLTFGTMLKNWFKRNQFTPTLCNTIASAIDELKANDYKIVLSDLRLPDKSGTDLLHWVRERDTEIPFIIMTSYADIRTAVDAIKSGADDFIEKPLNPDILKEKVNFLLSASYKVNEIKERFSNSIKDPISEQEVIETAGYIKGVSGSSKLLEIKISKVAPTDMSVLIIGESGTGKEIVANQLHVQSKRSNYPFIALDCGILSKELAASELFGYKKGAFTGATKDKKGIFEEAEGGTVFLDEIGNLPYDVQVQLLRTIQEKKIRPVGCADDKTINVRIISATNENLAEAIKEGRFREDLYHRLNELTLSTIPLRDRIDDIQHFASFFLKKSNSELRKSIKGFNKESMEILKSYMWPGNLREMKNVIKRAVLFSEGEFITEQDFLDITTSPNITSYNNSASNSLDINEAIDKAGGNKAKAARMLNISRKTLYNKLNKE